MRVGKFNSSDSTWSRSWLLLAPIVLLPICIAIAPQPALHDTPLLWDMAHHTLRSEALASTIRDTDLKSTLAQLRTWDVYPPFLYVAAAGAMLLADAQNWAWSLLRILLWCTAFLAMWLGLSTKEKSSIWVAMALLAGNAQLLSLSSQRMLDFPAAVVALLALACLVRLHAKPSVSRGIVACAACAAALLSKHNAGLPLLPVAWMLATERIWRRDTRGSIALISVTILALIVWAAFLTWQDHGWKSFLSFAVNRANSADLNPLERARWYLASWARRGYGNEWLALQLVVVVFALRARSTVAFATCGYAICSFAAICFHPYLLDRNFTSTAVMLCIPCAIGWVKIGRISVVRQAQPLLVGAAVVLLLAVSRQRAAEDYDRVVPERLELLSPASTQLSAWFADGGRTTTFGSFNELSSPWLELLWARTGRPKSELALELPYPLPRRREGLDSSPNKHYNTQFERWTESGLPEFVITLELDARSPFRSGDYAAWNAWKQNYISLVERSSEFLLIDRYWFESAGLTISRFTTEIEPISWGDGFKAPEAWGRWMTKSSGAFSIPALDDARTLVVEISPHHEQLRPIRVAVSIEAEAVANWVIEGVAWRYQPYALSLEPSAVPRQVTLQVLDDGRVTGGSEHLLALGHAGLIERSER